MISLRFILWIRSWLVVAGVLGTAFPTLAHAEIRVGITLSTTGPAASLGIPERNTVALLPGAMGGHKIQYIVLDDASEADRARANALRLIREQGVDVIVGPSTSPNALALLDIVAAAETPMLALAASARVIEPMDERRAWAFKTPPSESIMLPALMEHILERGFRRLAFIGFADAYGASWWSAFSHAAANHSLQVTAQESFDPAATGVDGQVEAIMASRPEAVLIAASGTPAALPHKTLRRRGFTGMIYQTHGAANADFLRIGGTDVEGSVLPAGPVLVADQLPADHPAARAARDYVGRYETRYGKGSASGFGAHLWDAGLLLQRAIPEALKKAQPGTVGFRRALRDALERVGNLAGPNGVFNMSANDHLGIDRRSRVLVRIENGLWKLVR